MRKTLLFVMGPTNSGKTTLINHLCSSWPNIYSSIQIGQEFRKRHPPEYFEGKAAMEKTENEAIEIFGGAYVKWLADPTSKVLLVDGVPRLPKTTRFYADLAMKGDHDSVFLYLTCSDAKREERLSARDKDPAAVELSRSRLNGDKIQYHDTLLELLQHGEFIPCVIDTTEWGSAEDGVDALEGLVSFGE